MRRWGILFLCFSTVLFAACAGSSSPESVVERYLQAKITGDTATVQSLLCADMESVRLREASAFSSVSAEIEQMACSAGENAETVTCTGQIVATYGTEKTTFALGTYHVVREDESWKWCGEAR